MWYVLLYECIIILLILFFVYVNLKNIFVIKEGGVGKKIVSGIKKTSNDAGGAITDTANKAVGGASDVIDTSKDFGKDMYDSSKDIGFEIKELGQDILGVIGDSFSNLLGSVNSLNLTVRKISNNLDKLYTENTVDQENGLSNIGKFGKFGGGGGGIGKLK